MRSALAPLTGLLAVIFTVVAFVLLGDTPDADSAGGEVRAFYSSHEGRGAVSLYLLVLAGPLFVFFTARLARDLHGPSTSGSWLHHVVFGSGLLIAVGFWTGASIALALLDLSDEPEVGDGTLQTLNSLSESFFIPLQRTVLHHGAANYAAAPVRRRSSPGRCGRERRSPGLPTVRRRGRG
jgi:hypothetical protein